MKRRGILRLSFERLATMLRLPEGASVVGFCVDDKSDCVEVKVDHHRMPAVNEGDIIQYVGEPVYVKDEAGKDVFLGWRG